MEHAAGAGPCEFLRKNLVMTVHSCCIACKTMFDSGKLSIKSVSMAKAFAESAAIPYSHSGRHLHKNPWFKYLIHSNSPKLSVYLLSLFALTLILFLHIHIQAIQIPFPQRLQKPTLITANTTPQVSSSSSILQGLHHNYCTEELNSMATKLRESVTFLPLKDLRYSSKPLQGHTWFMSSLKDTHEKGEVQFQEFPSQASKGRILCLKGGDSHDGSWNSYALAWPQFLPPNSTLMTGLTFVSYNHYNYHNIWHGLSSAVPFVAWHVRTKCLDSPTRWVLYHWGELRASMGPWLRSLMEAAFDAPLNIFEGFDGGEDGYPTCFEKAVVMRHNEGGMNRDRRLEVYDFLRCKARVFCNVSKGRNQNPKIGMTMFMRTGGRSFRDDAAVIKIFDRACRKVPSCHLTVSYANNLSFCQQVELMASTDVLVSPHGAQLTNMFLMDRNSSVLEFFPKGWLKLAGIGQYVYHWIASWSGMNHRGAWRDTGGYPCPFPEDDRRCMSVYKNAKIGHNQSYFSEWAENVLNDVIKLRKANNIGIATVGNSCGCDG